MGNKKKNKDTFEKRNGITYYYWIYKERCICIYHNPKIFGLNFMFYTDVNLDLILGDYTIYQLSNYLYCSASFIDVTHYGINCLLILTIGCSDLLTFDFDDFDNIECDNLWNWLNFDDIEFVTLWLDNETKKLRIYRDGAHTGIFRLDTIGYLHYNFSENISFCTENGYIYKYENKEKLCLGKLEEQDRHKYTKLLLKGCVENLFYYPDFLLEDNFKEHLGFSNLTIQFKFILDVSHITASNVTYTDQKELFRVTITKPILKRLISNNCLVSYTKEQRDELKNLIAKYILMGKHTFILLYITSNLKLNRFEVQ